MPTAQPFCRELADGVKGALGHLPATTRKRVLFLVLGILLARSVVLRRIACEQHSFCGGSTLAASHERRLRRITNDPLITWEQVYLPTAKMVLKWQQAERLTVLVDESGHSEHFRVLMASVWYRNRAVPLAWVSWPAQRPLSGSYWDYVEALLAKVARLLPQGPQIVVAADRAFGNPAFTDRVAARGWEWLVRLQQQTCFRDAQGRCRQMNQLISGPGQRRRGRGLLFKKAGWREGSYVAYWSTRHQEPLLLASSLRAGWDLIALYRRRGAIETLFRDWKSSGWAWEASQVRDLAHHERLLLGMALATVVVLCLGNQVAQQVLAEGAHARRSQRWHAKHSLFRLGLDRLRACVYGTAAPACEWALADFAACGWQSQLHQADARTYIIAHPLPQAA